MENLRRFSIRKL